MGIRVPADYFTRIRAPERRIIPRVTIDYTDIELDATIMPSATEQARISYLTHTHDAITAPRRRWLSLDGSCLADGTAFLMPAPAEASLNQVGWWGSQLAAADGAFGGTLPALTVTHAARPVHQLSMHGDSVRGEWPRDFTIQLFAGDDLRHTQTVIGNTAVAWAQTIPVMIGITRQVLTISRWSHAGRQMKILEFFTSISEIYLADDVVSINLFEEKETVGGSPVGHVSANALTVTLHNRGRRFDAGNELSPLHNILRPNRRVRAELGMDALNELGQIITVWVPLGLFYSTEWLAREEEVTAKVAALDRLERLRNSIYDTSPVWQNVSVWTIADAVLRHAGVPVDRFALDSALHTVMVPWAWFEPVSHREVLRQVAEMALTRVYCDRQGIIRVEAPGAILAEDVIFLSPCMPTQVGQSINADNFFRKDNPMKWGGVWNKVEVGLGVYRADAAASEIYRSPEPVPIAAGQTLTITVRFNTIPAIDAAASLATAPTGATIQASTHFAWGSRVTVHSPAAGTFTLVINGRPIREVAREQIVSQNDASIAMHGEQLHKFPSNHLVQTTARAQTIADVLLRLGSNPQRNLTLDWRGNPALTLGDLVTISEHSRQGVFTVVRQELDYDGALRARLEGIRI